MAQINSSDHIQRMVSSLRLSSWEKIPAELADKVLPVFFINFPHQIYFKNTTAANSTTTTIHTCSTTMDTYICGCSLSVIKDVTSTSTGSSINATPYGQATAIQLIRIASLTTTVQNDTLSQTFFQPIRLARGSTITVTNTTNVANVSATGCIHFYEVPSN